MSDKEAANPLSRRTWLGDVFERGRPGSNHYALTFDDGPLPGCTDAILDILAAHQIKATFFVIGLNIQNAPDLLRRIDREGHLVGNHTWTHSRLGLFGTVAYWRNEIRRTDELIQSIIGKTPRLFRPPMGWRTPANSGAIRELGHANILWSLKARDGVTTTRDRILKRIIPNISGGDILLIHDGRDAASRRDYQPTIDALPDVIKAYQDRGLTAVRLDELLEVNPYVSAT